LGAFNSFVSTYDTTNTELPYSSDSDSLRIPLIGTELSIDWGDGSVDTNVTSSEVSPASHTYASSGIYTVRTSGNLTQIRYAGDRARDRRKLIGISQWGDIAWTSFNDALSYTYNFELSATDAPDLSNVTDMSSMFRNASSFNSPINHWDVSNVTNFYRMFYNAGPFDQNLDTWDITNVTDMRNFMIQAGVSTSNYDAILIGWEATLQAAYPSGTGYGFSINVNFGSSTYTGGGAAATAKASLVSTFNMTIIDGGIA
jgi:surface protein